MVVVVLVVAGIWFYVARQDNSDSETIKIGALYAQTGAAAKYGQISIQGVNDAVEYFKTKNPETKVELIVEDSQGDAKEATIAATKLATVDRVNFSVVGTSAVSAAVAPIADQYKKIFISDAALFGLTEGKKYIFQNFMPDFNKIPLQINANSSWKKVAIIYINDDLGNVWSKGVKASIDSSRSVELFSFEKGATDFKTDALKLKNYNPDVVVFVGYGPALNQVFADLELNKINKPYLTYLACTLPGVLTDKKFSLEGQYSYEFPVIKDGEVKNWMVAKNRDLNSFYTIAFENTLLVLEVAKESGNNVERGLEILKNKQQEGVFGTIDFRGKNYTNIDLVPTMIRGGKCVPLVNE